MQRGRRERRRSVGLWLILGGLVLVSLAVFVLVALETTIVGSGGLAGCGSALAPVPGGDSVCGEAHVELWIVGGGLALVGIAALASGILLRVLNPRPLSF